MERREMLKGLAAFGVLALYIVPGIFYIFVLAYQSIVTAAGAAAEKQNADDYYY